MQMIPSGSWRESSRQSMSLTTTYRTSSQMRHTGTSGTSSLQTRGSQRMGLLVACPATLIEMVSAQLPKNALCRASMPEHCHVNYLAGPTRRGHFQLINTKPGQPSQPSQPSHQCTDTMEALIGTRMRGHTLICLKAVRSARFWGVGHGSPFLARFIC